MAELTISTSDERIVRMILEDAGERAYMIGLREAVDASEFEFDDVWRIYSDDITCNRVPIRGRFWEVVTMRRRGCCLGMARQEISEQGHRTQLRDAESAKAWGRMMGNAAVRSLRRAADPCSGHR